MLDLSSRVVVKILCDSKGSALGQIDKTDPCQMDEMDDFYYPIRQGLPGGLKYVLDTRKYDGVSI
jgi:hypothetical protein